MPPQPQDSLNHSMDKAKKHYSSLFFLPSFKKALIATTIICVVGVNLTAFALFPAINSIMLGFGLLVVTVTADLIVSKILLRDDPLFNMRRTSAMSMYNWLLWLAFLALGTALGYFFEPSLWVKLALIGFEPSQPRTIVLMATSFSTKFQQALSAFLQPTLRWFPNSFLDFNHKHRYTTSPNIRHFNFNNRLPSRIPLPTLNRQPRKIILRVTCHVILQSFHTKLGNRRQRTLREAIVRSWSKRRHRS